MASKNSVRSKSQLKGAARQRRKGEEQERGGPGSKGPSPAFSFTAEAERLAYHIRTVL